MTPPGSRLRRHAQRPAPPQPEPDAPERCGLCGQGVEARHRHIVDLHHHSLMCACRPCAILFDNPAAGKGHYRLVPERRLRLEGFELDDARWAGLRIPVEMAFFFHSTPMERVAAFYPGPMGATESQLDLATWQDLEADNPVLAELEPDVEALLVHRAAATPAYYLLPIDDTYRLVGLIRTHWSGLSGGGQVWREIGDFFEELERRSKVRAAGAVHTSAAAGEPAVGG
jgi:hypothetical protein